MEDKPVMTAGTPVRLHAVAAMVACLAISPCPAADCNANGADDADDIADGTSLDFNGNAIPDECDWDCNGDGLNDALQVDAGDADDCDGNGVPDECDIAPRIAFEPPFALPVVPAAAGTEAVGLAPADFDGDGRSDLAVAFPFQLAVLRNVANGDFDLLGSQPVGSNPVVVVAADFDGDGKPDLASANSLGADDVPDNVSLFLNDGRGGFPRSTNFAAGQGPTDMLADDLNGDGALDIVVANDVSRDVSVLLNRGGGSFFGAVHVDLQRSPRSLTTADVDVDGDTDIVVAVPLSDRIVVLKNDGDGRFASRENLDGLVREPALLSAADFDADGDIDLAVARRRFRGDEAEIVVLRNRGDGRFERLVRYSAGNSIFFSTPDVDNDEAADIVSISDTAVVSTLFNHGTGSFLTGRERRLPSSLRAGIAAMADFSGDGLLDIAVTIHGDLSVAFATNRLDCDFAGANGRCGLEDCNRNGIPDACDPEFDPTAPGVPAECRVVEEPLCEPPGGPGCIPDVFGIVFDNDLSVYELEPFESGSCPALPGRNEVLTGGDFEACPVLPFSVVLDTQTARIQGWSFGVRYDSDTVTVLHDSLRVGREAAENIVPPDFQVVEIVFPSDPGRRPSAFVSAVVLSLISPAFLPFGRSSVLEGEVGLHEDPGPEGTLLRLANQVDRTTGQPVDIVFTVDGESALPETLRHGKIVGPSRRPAFIRGDVDASGDLNLTDAVALARIIIGRQEPAVSCEDALDANDDGRTNISDAVAILFFLFGRAPTLPPPFPDCGSDPTGTDSLRCLEVGPFCDR